MEAFQAALDALVKESKDQITQVQTAAVTAILSAHVVPHRIAVALGQRFTPARVESAFPVLCLLDASLVRLHAATTATAAAPPASDQALAAVLKEFWQLAPAVCVTMHAYGAQQPAWREKCLRMVRRWKQRKLLKEELVDALITSIESGVDVTSAAAAAADPSSSAHGGNNSSTQNDKGDLNVVSRSNDSRGAGEKGSEAASSSSPAIGQNEEGEERSQAGASTRSVGEFTAATSTRPQAMAFTAAQTHAFRATLQACMSALECLPPARRSLYFELIHEQRFRTPTKTALTFFEDLLSELRREVTSATSATTTTAAPAGSSKPGDAHHHAGGSSSNNSNTTTSTDPASAGHAREALGKLLAQLSTNGGEDGAGGRSGSGGGGASATGAVLTAATTVVRYVSPIFSDVYAKQPLGQRGSGFGILQRKAEHGSTNNAFYTSYFPKAVANAQRPFRIPSTMQMHGGTVRLWFPRSSEWVAAQDMADIAQYASRNVAEKARKRSREEEA